MLAGIVHTMLDELLPALPDRERMELHTLAAETVGHVEYFIENLTGKLDQANAPRHAADVPAGA